MFNGRGNANNIVCPLHRWTYDLKGELIGAPHFAETPCLNLSKTPLQNWNGLLFEQNGYNVMDKLAQLSVAKDFDFSGYMFDHVEVHELRLQLEDLHRGLPGGLPRRAVPSGPGRLRQLRRPALGIRPRLQRADRGRATAACRRPARPIYRKWQEQVLKFRGGEPPEIRRDLAHAVPEHHGRVVSARAGRVHAVAGRPAEDPQRGRVLLSRRNRAVRARVRRSRTGRLHGDLRRGRRDRPAHGCRPPHPAGRAASTKSGPTSRRWKTACSTSTSGTAASSTACTGRRPPDGVTVDAVRQLRCSPPWARA